MTPRRWTTAPACNGWRANAPPGKESCMRLLIALTVLAIPFALQGFALYALWGLLRSLFAC